MTKTNIEREKGQYFTKGNCFELLPFVEWFKSIPEYGSITLIEPFAGDGSIKSLMKQAGFNNDWKLYDLMPKNKNITERDSIINCPMGICIITNPPYLAKNSATRRGLKYPETNYDDVYKLALEKMLQSAPYVASIIPESFVTSGLFLERVSRIISLRLKMFDDTDCPVCLALFSPSDGFKIYSNNDLIGDMVELKKYLPKPKIRQSWIFNSPKGNVGLLAVDNTKNNSIKFIKGSMIPSSVIKVSSRAITRISVDVNIKNLDKYLMIANKLLVEFRINTHDVFFTSFKGIREDGQYRRRLDFRLARGILDLAFEEYMNAN